MAEETPKTAAPRAESPETTEEVKKISPAKKTPSTQETQEDFAAVSEVSRKIINLLSPEGIVIMGFAVLLDIAGAICLALDLAFGIGEIPSLISDIIGIIFLTSWLFFRMQVVAVPQPAQKRIAKKAKEEAAKKVSKETAKQFQRILSKTWVKFGLTVVGELLPVVGGLPLWSLTVYSILTH